MISRRVIEPGLVAPALAKPDETRQRTLPFLVRMRRMMEIVKTSVRRELLQQSADESFGDFVKAVVDIDRQVMAIGGELHADEEAVLLEDGSRQSDLWGINIYPSLKDDALIEFDSMINVRPALGNRSRSVENAETRARIVAIVHKLIKD